MVQTWRYNVSRADMVFITELTVQWERQRSNYDNGCKVIKRGKYDLLIQHRLNSG